MADEPALLLPDQLAALRRYGVERHYAPGERMIALGAASTEVFYLVEGLVKIVVMSPSGTESMFGRRSGGDFVGEMSTLNNEPRSAEVITVEPTTAIVATASRFTSFLEEHSSVTIAMLRMQSRRLDEMTNRVLLGSRSVRARVAQRLLELAEPGRNNVVALTQTDLAQYVDASREWTSKALGSLRRDGAIRTERGRVIVLDHALLLDASLDP